MNSFFIPAEPSIKAPSAGAIKSVSSRRGNATAGTQPPRKGQGDQQHRREGEDILNKINYAKCPSAHQSGGNNGHVSARPHDLPFLSMTDSTARNRQLIVISSPSFSPFLHPSIIWDIGPVDVQECCSGCLIFEMLSEVIWRDWFLCSSLVNKPQQSGSGSENSQILYFDIS